MPISSSVITGTKAHSHTIDSSDGGKLDFDGVTLADLSDGSITYEAHKLIKKNNV